MRRPDMKFIAGLGFVYALIFAACSDPIPASRADQAAQNTTEQGRIMRIEFKTPEEKSRWQSVNDGVMGGRSSGGASFEDGNLLFSGVINTNGGGFSSIRYRSPEKALASASGMRLRVKTDGRDYKLSFRTDATHWRRSVAFQAPLNAKGSDWQTVDIDFSDLKASVFGRSVREKSFDPSKVRQLGLILADGQDGPFELQVEWMEAIPEQ